MHIPASRGGASAASVSRPPATTARGISAATAATAASTASSKPSPPLVYIPIFGKKVGFGRSGFSIESI